MKLPKHIHDSLWYKLQQLAENAPWIFILIDKDGAAHILTNATHKSAVKIAELTLKTIKKPK